MHRYQRSDLSRRQNVLREVKGVTGSVEGSREWTPTVWGYIFYPPIFTAVRTRPREMIALQEGYPSAVQCPSFPDSAHERYPTMPIIPEFQSSAHTTVTSAIRRHLPPWTATPTW